MKQQAKAAHAEFDARVAEWDSRIKEIEARYERVQATVSTETAELLDGLRLARDDAKAQIAKLKKASDRAWERSRTAVESSFNEVSAAYEAIRRRLK